MIDVSATLQAARERAGLTLDEISSRTKIKVAFLQAIERGDFERLPGAFFARAFLRTYARELRLSPDEIVAAYDARFAPVVAQAPAGTSPPASMISSLPPSPDEGGRWTFALPSPRSVWPTVLLGIAVITVISMMTRPVSEKPNDVGAVGTSGVAAAAPAATSPQPDARPQKLTIDIRPSRTLWVAGLADGKRVIYRLVAANEHVRIDANEDLWFRVGDAGAFLFSINGSPEKPLGASGEVREFRITHDNYRSFGQ